MAGEVEGKEGKRRRGSGGRRRRRGAGRGGEEAAEGVAVVCSDSVWSPGRERG